MMHLAKPHRAQKTKALRPPNLFAPLLALTEDPPQPSELPFLTGSSSKRNESAGLAPSGALYVHMGLSQMTPREGTGH